MTKALFIQAMAKFFMGVVLMGVLLFVPAGTLGYWNGWLLLAILFIPMFCAGLVLMRRNPALLRRRLPLISPVISAGITPHIAAESVISGSHPPLGAIISPITSAAAPAIKPATGPNHIPVRIVLTLPRDRRNQPPTLMARYLVSTMVTAIIRPSATIFRVFHTVLGLFLSIIIPPQK